MSEVFSDGLYLLGDIGSKVSEKEVGEEVLTIWRMKRRYEIWEWQREKTSKYWVGQNIPSVRYYGGEGNGTPLQYSCLENPMDRGAWWAAICGVAKTRT